MSENVAKILTGLVNGPFIFIIIYRIIIGRITERSSYTSKFTSKMDNSFLKYFGEFPFVNQKIYDIMIFSIKE